MYSKKNLQYQEMEMEHNKILILFKEILLKQQANNKIIKKVRNY